MLPCRRTTSVRHVSALASKIKSAPHRDVSHLSFAEILQLFVSMRQQCAMSEEKRQSCTASSFSAEQQHDSATRTRLWSSRLFDEWCLRSVFSKGWSEVALDSDPWFLQPTSEKECGAVSSSEVEDKSDVLPPNSLLHMSWDVPRTVGFGEEQLPTTTTTPTAKMDSSGEPLIVLTSSLFLASRSDGSQYLNSLLDITRNSHPASSEAPPTSPTSATAAASKSGMEAKSKKVAPPSPTFKAPPSSCSFVLIPFSVLREVRRHAFSDVSLSNVSNKVSCTSSIQLVQQVLATQLHAIATSNRRPSARLVVVPPSVECELVMNLCQKQRTMLGPEQTSCSLAEMCKSSVALWSAVAAQSTSGSVASVLQLPQVATTKSFALCVSRQAVDDRRLAQRIGAPIASHAQSRDVFKMKKSDNTHAVVMQRCTEAARKLAVREESLLTSMSHA